ncbi:MAG TPA: LacI family DNA-binding transcriptional regulator [Phycisphaerae bacterium]|nr:LacI family DNA-binding transcriptional regulator [Phycisphaerae bacterium]HOJ75215.1 LacI family DNA-binding transcriptional regulator [Phycisphaerae bacterium]HOM52434.1 LacI family DNA-binding transcriptional regulator [Phycisphaerae bacterium]HON66723.1 LacI family DNA-binding transcriptional regulator [Phycisphaerae bacterium]HOQ85918.1 LacI family DNA-binding transcriptional regulator [Phycisphaerae bacterium]
MAKPPSHPVTTVELAARLGISPSTVSIVLRGQSERRKISARTVERVLQAARELNYVPNQWARNLRRQKSGMIGVILASFRWDWAQELTTGMAEVFESTGYTPFVAVHAYQPERARRELLSCLQRRDEAIIMVPLPGLDDAYERARAMGIPIVFVADRPSTLADAHFVAWDSPADIKLAVEHLVQIGRRRIGFVGFDYPMPLNAARYRAYRSVLQRAGLPIDPRWVARGSMLLSPEEIIEKSIAQLFQPGQPHPDAIVVQHDGLATLLLDAIRTHGIRVPDDVALIGMGDYPITRFAGVSLSTVKEPIAEIGREAAKAALDLLSHPTQPPIQRLLPCGELKIRHTTVPGASGA